jgi:hypothetical protein
MTEHSKQILSRVGIYTGYYAGMKKYAYPFPVAISAQVPAWFKGPSLRSLAPDWRLLSDWKARYQFMGDEGEGIYRARYQNVLEGAGLDELARLLEESGKDAVTLMCYERPGDFCHRRLVAWHLFHEAGTQCIDEYLVPKEAK